MGLGTPGCAARGRGFFILLKYLRGTGSILGSSSSGGERRCLTVRSQTHGCRHVRPTPRSCSNHDRGFVFFMPLPYLVLLLSLSCFFEEFRFCRGGGLISISCGCVGIHCKCKAKRERDQGQKPRQKLNERSRRRSLLHNPMIILRTASPFRHQHCTITFGTTEDEIA